MSGTSESGELESLHLKLKNAIADLDSAKNALHSEVRRYVQLSESFDKKLDRIMTLEQRIRDFKFSVINIWHYANDPETTMKDIMEMTSNLSDSMDKLVPGPAQSQHVCRRDTDGDGNCHVHPRGCPIDVSKTHGHAEEDSNNG